MIWGDYHTHTKYSDGKGTVEDTLRRADELGLKEVGISDHGLRHIARGTSLKKLAKARDEMDRLADKYKVRCFLSIEANVFTSDGWIDLKDDQLGIFDYVIAGYHKAVWPKNLAQTFKYSVPAVFADWRRQFTNAQRRKYTGALVGAIKSGKVAVITHPNYGIPCFAAEVGKAAADYGVLLELNGKHVDLTDEEMQAMYDAGANFILSSDAHSPSRLADVDKQVAVVDRLGWDKSRIANWEQLPKFIKRN